MLCILDKKNKKHYLLTFQSLHCLQKGEQIRLANDLSKFDLLKDTTFSVAFLFAASSLLAPTHNTLSDF